MKIKLLALTLILSSPLLQATEGSLTLSGAITDSTCNVLGVISDSEISTAQPVLNPVITLTNLSEYSNSATSFRWFQIHIKTATQRLNGKISASV